MTHQIHINAGRAGLWCAVSLAIALVWSSATAQRQSLQPVENSFVERIDPEERISGNATTGLMIRGDEETIGLTKLWAFLSNDDPTTLTLTISSVDGRYHAEAQFLAQPMDGAWLPVQLTGLADFDFLEGYSNPMDEVAVLLLDENDFVYYPLRWGPSHSSGDESIDGVSDTDRLLIYVNTERADAFVVEDGRPSMCREASELSGFKFDAICEISIEQARSLEPVAANKYAVRYLRVHRRVGTRSLDPVDIQLQFVFQADAADDSQVR